MFNSVERLEGSVMAQAAVGQVVVEELTREEGAAAFEDACQRELGVSGTDFTSAYDSGAYPADWSPEAICRLEMLLPLAR
jgi:hypothetical protein